MRNSEERGGRVLPMGGTDRPAVPRGKGEITQIEFGRGYGFIIGEDGTELFFHAAACDGTPLEDLKVGDGVTFEKVYSTKGMRALLVRREELGG